MRVAKPLIGRFLRFVRLMFSVSCLFSTRVHSSTPPASNILLINIITLQLYSTALLWSTFRRVAMVGRAADGRDGDAQTKEQGDTDCEASHDSSNH
jgi:hypothetical protein